MQGAFWQHRLSADRAAKMVSHGCELVHDCNAVLIVLMWAVDAHTLCMVLWPRLGAVSTAQ